MTKWTKISLFFSILIAMVSFSFLAGIRFSNVRGSEEATDDIEKAYIQVSSTDQQWRVYRDADFGFYFQYPSNINLLFLTPKIWSENSIKKLGLTTKSGVYRLEGENPNVTFTLTNDKIGSSLEDIRGRSTQITIGKDNITAIRYERAYPGGGMETIEVPIADDIFLRIQFIFEEKERTIPQDILNKILDSFGIDKGATG